jgi:acyl carrier protein
MGMTADEALKWLAKVFEVPADNLRPETAREAIPAWDSLGTLTLMAGLDEKFGVALTDAEIRGMTRAGDVIELLKRHGKLSG